MGSQERILLFIEFIEVHFLCCYLLFLLVNVVFSSGGSGGVPFLCCFIWFLFLVVIALLWCRSTFLPQDQQVNRGIAESSSEEVGISEE